MINQSLKTPRHEQMRTFCRSVDGEEKSAGFPLDSFQQETVMSAKLSEEIAESCGDDAINALKNMGKWEYSPDSAECGMFLPYNCGGEDNCNYHWHGMWYVLGIRIENGHLFETVHSCDSNGNWEYQDEMDVDDPNYPQWKKQYDFSEHEKIMREYHQWVAKHGKDPLDQFFIKYNKLRNRQVTVHLGKKGFYVKNPKRLNPQVKEYLNLVGNKLADIDWKSIQEFAEKACLKKIIRSTKNSITIIVETNEPVPPSSIKKQLKALAKNCL